MWDKQVRNGGIKKHLAETSEGWGMSALRFVMSKNVFVLTAKRSMYEGIIVPTMHLAETRGMRRAERLQVSVLEMKFLGSMAYFIFIQLLLSPVLGSG